MVGVCGGSCNGNSNERLGKEHEWVSVASLVEHCGVVGSVLGGLMETPATQPTYIPPRPMVKRPHSRSAHACLWFHHKLDIDSIIGLGDCGRGCARIL